MVLSNALKSRIYAVIAAVVLVLIAMDIIVLARGVLGPAVTIAINLAVLGALLLVYSFLFREKSEKTYYGFWGLFLIILGVVVGLWDITGDWVISAAIFFAGIAGLIIYVSFLSK